MMHLVRRDEDVMDLSVLPAIKTKGWKMKVTLKILIVLFLIWLVG